MISPSPPLARPDVQDSKEIFSRLLEKQSEAAILTQGTSWKRREDSPAARDHAGELSADGHLEVARIAGTIGSIQSVLTRSDALLGDGPPGILQPLRPSPTVQTITP